MWGHHGHNSSYEEVNSLMITEEVISLMVYEEVTSLMVYKEVYLPYDL